MPTQLDRIEALLAEVVSLLKESRVPRLGSVPLHTAHAQDVGRSQPLLVPSPPAAPSESDPLRSPEIRCMSMLDTLRRSFP